ncbi:MAG: FMN-binding protein [Ruminococcaceae bacterium]|nr:FMN-binding protein [Oscillospiraceae bacterium]
MKKSIVSTLVLVCICAVMAVLLAITNAITAPTIKANEDKAANEALLEVMPNGEGFEKVDLSAYTLPATVTEVFKETKGGYVVKMTTTGYSSGMVIMCGVNPDGTISGTVCLSSSETLGHEKTFGAGFTGKDAASVDAVDTISGATKTTQAYKNAVKDALNTAIILGGGSVDLRDEAQILNDNLSAALPAAEGKFTKLFITEIIEADCFDAVYTADNGAGKVFVTENDGYEGNTCYTAVDKNGNVTKTTYWEEALAAYNILTASTVEIIDLKAYEGLPTALTSAKRTATGNYILTLNAAGYGINGGSEYHPASGQYILVMVSLTKEGKIIDTLTLSQAESTGIGDACADEKFYGQFDGKTAEDYKNIDAISGATITTNGYLKAIERAFECVTILEGGAANE